MRSLIYRYSFLLRNIIASNYHRLEFPYKLTFSVTDKCNSRCKTCRIWQRTPRDELRIEEIQEFFKKSNQFSWIDLTGGEISLRDGFLEIVDIILSECKDLCLLHFPTNGLLTNKIVSIVESIMKLKPPKLILTVSMDGDEELNDFIRGIPGGWKRQLDTFRALHSIAGVQTVLGMTLCSFNYDKFEMVFKAVKQECPWISYKDFHINVAHSSDHYYDNKDLEINQMPVDVVVGEVKQYMNYRGRPMTPVSFLEREYLKRVESYLRSGRTPIHCQALSSSCFLDPVGNIFPCGMYDVVVGNLRDYGYDLRKIWQSDLCRKTQKDIWKFKCPQCWTPCEAYQSILGNIFNKHYRD